MKLKDTHIRNVKSVTKTRKMYDGGGLYLSINPSGSRLWRMKYRYAGKEKLLSFGKYLEVSLKEVRDLRYEARKLLDEGKAPSYVKQQRRSSLIQESENSFRQIALEFLEKKSKACTEKYVKKNSTTYGKERLPYIGDQPINEIKPSELFSLLDRIDNQGKVEIAHRVKRSY